MKNEQNTKTEYGSQAAVVVTREQIIESLKIWGKFKAAEYERYKIELFFLLLTKRTKP